MQFMIRAIDGAGKLEKRMEVRAQHLENMSRGEGRVLCAGGLLDDDGKMKGSLLVMEFETRAQLKQYLRTEPYIVSGVWETVEVEPMNVVLLDGRPAGK